MDEETRAKVNKRFYGHDKLKSKYTPKLPSATEREYARIVKQYMKLLKDEVEASLPEFKRIYKQELRESDEYRQNYRADSATGLMLAIERTFQKIGINLSKKVEQFGLTKKLTELANLGRKLTVREWKKVIFATLGINIMEDYYSGVMFKRLMDQWVSQNVDLISTIPHETLSTMKELVYEGYAKGQTTASIAKAIKDAYGISRSHALFIARDQCAKLNGDIQREQQMNAGITHYIWSTSDDERVRSCHAEFDGKVFSWNDPPEIWYETKRGRVYTGRRCHPGQDYNCRCIGRPVFNREGLDLPTESEEKNE